MKKIQLLSLALSALCISACSNASEDANSDNSTTATDSANIISTAISSRNDIFSEQEIEKMDRNYKILIKYIKISEDSTSYILDISEEEAIKLNVDKEYYQSTVESIRRANIALKEGFERGDDVELTDFKSLNENLNSK